MDDNNVIKEKSKSFAIRIINLYKYLTTNASQNEYVLSKQILRSGTSIGANVKEALRGHSKADFRAKMNIAFKAVHNAYNMLAAYTVSSLIGVILI